MRVAIIVCSLIFCTCFVDVGYHVTYIDEYVDKIELLRACQVLIYLLPAQWTAS